MSNSPCSCSSWCIGRPDTSLRSGTTLDALKALAAGGYVGRADGVQLDEAYRFLRSMEHRIQLYRLRRTHNCSRGRCRSAAHRAVARLRADPVVELNREWKRHAAVVRRLHQKLFYRPLLDAGGQTRPGREPAGPNAARTSPSGTPTRPRRCGIWRRWPPGSRGRPRSSGPCCPVLLGWFADSADPDAGLLNSRKVSDALGKTPWYLRLLRDEGAAAENLARVLSAGRLARTC